VTVFTEEGQRAGAFDFTETVYTQEEIFHEQQLFIFGGFVPRS
jgi:hypothetical protein